MGSVNVYTYLWFFGPDKYEVVSLLQSDVEDYTYKLWNIVAIAWLFFEVRMCMRDCNV